MSPGPFCRPGDLGTKGGCKTEIHYLFSVKTYPNNGGKLREYLFGLHSLSTLIWGQVKGWVESTVYMSDSLTPHLKDLIFLLHASGVRAVMRHLIIGDGGRLWPVGFPYDMGVGGFVEASSVLVGSISFTLGYVVCGVLV